MNAKSTPSTVPDKHVVSAAGAVLWRERPTGREVAVVHRPRYDDWSLPKGKVDPGETVPAAAVREVVEETGFQPVLGRFLRQIRYPLPKRNGRATKTVDYFSAEAVSGEFTANDEVDQLCWLSADRAADLVSYPDDREVLRVFAAAPARLTTLLLVRHAKAGKRDCWPGDDDQRPLSPAGARQAEALRALLPLFGVDRLHAAPRLRCAQTVRGAADDLGVAITDEPLLTEEAYWPDPDAGVARLREIAAAGGVPAVCSQGKVIPDLVARLAERTPLAARLAPDAVKSKKGSVWLLSFASADEAGFHHGELVDAHYLPSPLPPPGGSATS
ncbi:NUDIX hydrolase [Goodfellowiella coeruleoviolacea]|uniref:8-oxo-dGTP diphosphatase n=1 Tax=Goodfellowiella coeruleoviolacea TaxID=334858 RepID=A0AAE3KL18_9PSEU|nr:NUDIX hydrolase [Goodfellowiella coeruleoviolacea]MCP2169939.1 8-oxo-dGTP diphosphatase [Goodfellowiella coeruleoviolacea]